MSLLLSGLLLFLGLHSLAIFAPNQREALIARMGTGAFKGVYSIIATIGLVLIIYGYGMMRWDTPVFWEPPIFMRHLSALIMLPVFPLLLAAYLPGRIKRITKHPMLLAVKIWAFAHLLSNGALADVLLFGAFLAWAIADRISVKKRPASPPTQPNNFNDLLALGGGLVVYLLFVFGLHEWLIGVAPLG